MDTVKFDLIDIIRELKRKKKFILIFTLCSVIVGLIFCFVQKKQYTSESIFIVKSPQIMDRTRTYHTAGYDPTVFFATNDDVDNIVTIAKSNSLAEYIVEKHNLIKDYGYKTKDDAVKKFKKNLKVEREDTKNIELYFTHTDPEKAFEITKDVTNRIEDVFRDYFHSINEDMVKMLDSKITHINDTINILNDSIATIRKQYGLNSALPPSRGYAIINNNVQSHDSASARALEILQQYIIEKDKYIEIINNFTQLVQEYKNTMKLDDIEMLYRIQDAYKPDSPSFPKIPLTLLICLVGGILFSSILVTITAFYKKLVV